MAKPHSNGEAALAARANDVQARVPGLHIDGTIVDAKPGERIIDVLNRAAVKVPQVCYHPQMGAIQRCDTCMVEVDGKLVRACGTVVVGSVATTEKNQEERDR